MAMEHLATDVTLTKFSQFHMFYIFALFSVFIDNKSLYESFGFYKEHPIIIGFVLFSDALAPMDTVVKLLMNILSRKFEFEAGSYSSFSNFAHTTS
jgi:STE24 endopeptidase